MLLLCTHDLQEFELKQIYTCFTLIATTTVKELNFQKKKKERFVHKKFYTYLHTTKMLT